MRLLSLVMAAVFAWWSVVWPSTAWAFCGFYVASSDEPLTNRASRVVLVRDGARTLVTMASDVHGDPKEFALVIPVPTVIRREQVRIVKPEVVEHLADYTKPRLVEYRDDDPCNPRPVPAPMPMMSMSPAGAGGAVPRSRVRIEAAFSVAEYDILVLGADDSDGLIEWLNRNGYKMPAAAGPVVGSYLRQSMHFFVAKVNLARMRDNPTGFLRPIRVEYDTPKFMLPIRLGTVNAAGPQDMVVLALSRTGRVDVTNYRTVRMPTGDEIPEYVQARFGTFYDALFDRQVEAAGRRAVFLEYAWPIAANMALCDPCTGPVMRPEELDELGASWADQPGRGRGGPSGGAGAFVTRLHVRYDRDHFPEDLQFQETPDTEQYQARYVTRVAVKTWRGSVCPAGQRYRQELSTRWRQENANLARLTGWNPTEIRRAMEEHWERTKEQ